MVRTWPGYECVKKRPQSVKREDTKDTIVLLPEDKVNSCQRDSKCWRIPGVCTCIVTDDRVTSMMNDFDRDNAMVGGITFWRTCPFDN